MYKKTKLTGLSFFLIFFVTGCYLAPLKSAHKPPSQAFCKPLVCPTPKVIEKIIEIQIPPKTGSKLNLPIIGEVEKIQVEPSKFWYDARIDTGANSSSIHAENIQLIERDGEKYITFSLQDPVTKAKVKLERKYRRKVLIKQKKGSHERRYVVQLWLLLGGIKELVDVTLTNRSDFDYKLLIGRNLLTDTAIVDVSRKHVIK